MMSEARPWVGGGVLKSVTVVELQRQRRGQPRLVPAEIVARHRAADSFEVGCDLGRHVAAIKIGIAGMGNAVEGVGEARLHHRRTDFGSLAAIEVVRGEAWNVLQAFDIADGLAPLAGADRNAFASVANSGIEEFAARHTSAERSGGFRRQLPARHRAGHGERRQRPALRQRVVTRLAIALDRRQRAGRTAGIDRARRLARLGDDEEGIAADAGHLGIDDGDGGGRRDHRLDRVAAGAHHFRRSLRRRAVRRHRHALLADNRLVHHATHARRPGCVVLPVLRLVANGS